MNKRQLMQEGLWRGFGGLLPGLAVSLLSAIVINATVILANFTSNEAPPHSIGRLEIGISPVDYVTAAAKSSNR